MSAPLPDSAFAALDLPPSALQTLTLNEIDPNSAKPAESTHDENGALSPSFITMYAELLLNIRTVTLFASLRTDRDHETRAELSADGEAVTISHEGQKASIRLPSKIKGGGDAGLFLPAEPRGKELTLRLQMEEKEGMELIEGGEVEGMMGGKGNVVPWDAVGLNGMGDVKVGCKSCGHSLVRTRAVREWRDLPSENWAEMMDFWHCHKPDEHHLHGEGHGHGHGEEVGGKGYAAGNKLRAIRGVGFVDVVSLLVERGDCSGVRVSFSIFHVFVFLSSPPSLFSLQFPCPSPFIPTGCKESELSPLRLSFTGHGEYPTAARRYNRPRISILQQNLVSVCAEPSSSVVWVRRVWMRGVAHRFAAFLTQIMGLAG